MNKALILNSCCFCLFACVLVMPRGHDLRDVKRLKDQLFENNSYDKFIRPVWNQSNVVEVSHYSQIVVTSSSQCVLI